MILARKALASGSYRTNLFRGTNGSRSATPPSFVALAIVVVVVDDDIDIVSVVLVTADAAFDPAAVTNTTPEERRERSVLLPKIIALW